MTYSDSMQYLNQNILRPQTPQQAPQIDLFGNFEVKKQPPQQMQQTPKTTPNKVIIS